MMPYQVARRFLKDQSGAVTVEWTVLAAAVVGLGLTTASALQSGLMNLGSNTSHSVGGGPIDAYWDDSDEVGQPDADDIRTGGPTLDDGMLEPANDYQLLHQSADEFAAFVAYMSADTMSDADVYNNYTRYQNHTAKSYDNYDADGAAFGIDGIAGIEAAMRNRGMTPPSGTISAQDYTNMYHRRFG